MVRGQWNAKVHDQKKINVRKSSKAGISTWPAWASSPPRTLILARFELEQVHLHCGREMKRRLTFYARIIKSLLVSRSNLGRVLGTWEGTVTPSANGPSGGILREPHCPCGSG